MSALTFIHDLDWSDLPQAVQERLKLSLLDLIGVAAGGTTTRLSGIIRDMAAEDMPGNAPILFDHRTANPSAAAMAGGMTIDALDGHDGFNPSKGHIGCSLFPTALTIGQLTKTSGRAFLATMAMGYEFGARAAMAQHGTCPDYHTSGAWGAVTAAAAAARLMGLDPDQTRHALGIAEYHGPRSQMMRCIDYPTMLKDGSGWGAMTGLSAAQLARRGFTGAPAITVENAHSYWADLKTRWYMLEQYYKPYPVCRWAQAPIEGVLALRRAHGLTSDMVERIEVTSFHESIRLATNKPKTTEEAQYSTSFPCAVAMVYGTVAPEHIADEALTTPEVARLSATLTMTEDSFANAHFPLKRYAKTRLHLRDGRSVESDWMTPIWDHTAPPSAAELRAKYHALADPLLGSSRSAAIEAAIDALDGAPLTALSDLLYQPINR